MVATGKEKMKKLLWYKLNLQLFAGEGAESAPTGEESADAGQNSEVDVDKEFDEIINGKFKHQFTKKTQEIIDKRFKQTKELESYKNKVSPAVEILMEKYGIDVGEEERIVDFLSDDGENETEDVADDEMYSVIEAEEDDLSYRERLKGRIHSWLKQADEFKESMPDFDLRNEIRGNKLFSQMLLSGVPLKTAYETVHRDEILSGAMAYTAGKVREQVVKGIQAKGMRPMENGISSESAIVTSVDVNNLTSQDILKILKQVENGASIKF